MKSLITFYIALFLHYHHANIDYGGHLFLTNHPLFELKIEKKFQIHVD